MHASRGITPHCNVLLCNVSIGLLHWLRRPKDLLLSIWDNRMSLGQIHVLESKQSVLRIMYTLLALAHVFTEQGPCSVQDWPSWSAIRRAQLFPICRAFGTCCIGMMPMMACVVCHRAAARG